MGEKIIISCPNCSEKCRVPVSDRTIRVRCPHCSFVFDFEPRSEDDTGEIDRAFYSRRIQQLASRMISFDSNFPGSVKTIFNPSRINVAAEALKQEGFKKRFFDSAESFVLETFLRYQNAAEVILPHSLLSGNRNSKGLHNIWSGHGLLLGEEGLFQMEDFSDERKSQMVWVIDLSPMIQEFSDLLDKTKEPKRVV